MENNDLCCVERKAKKGMGMGPELRSNVAPNVVHVVIVVVLAHHTNAMSLSGSYEDNNLFSTQIMVLAQH